MNIYKLEYASKKALETALLNRGILTQDEDGIHYAQGTHAVVYLGHIALQKAVLDEQGNEVSPAVISDKYHADIMTEQEYTFGSNEVKIAKGEPVTHSFGL